MSDVYYVECAACGAPVSFYNVRGLTVIVILAPCKCGKVTKLLKQRNEELVNMSNYETYRKAMGWPPHVTPAKRRLDATTDNQIFNGVGQGTKY